ncbi:hypothetical protein MFUM_560006 [Methylacidiphilum fumariolicum SolV]|uniref:Uncharacterized protein n=2 Tax=Candidatus Methylacidiphilum fumarolicum TaxID=591154 RepID=I0JYG6_METFB|nr:conserved protein of unknown function [Candidatus Methylacidiphilum fumarolicum]CCG92285.1 hypothetical protein MFUM_560006 [Methylacidiphilum fumariolicum SolV]
MLIARLVKHAIYWVLAVLKLITKFNSELHDPQVEASAPVIESRF